MRGWLLWGIGVINGICTGHQKDLHIYFFQCNRISTFPEALSRLSARKQMPYHLSELSFLYTGLFLFISYLETMMNWQKAVMQMWLFIVPIEYILAPSNPFPHQILVCFFFSNIRSMHCFDQNSNTGIPFLFNALEILML